MGCFASTCCVSGLSIQSGDPVYFGLVHATGSYYAVSPVDSLDAFQFISPLFAGNYNDYGNIHYDGIGNKEAFEYYFRLLANGLYNFEEESREVDIPNKNLGELFDHLVYQDLIYDPDRGRPHLARSSQRIYIYMVHKWAYEKLVSFATLPERALLDISRLLTTETERSNDFQSKVASLGLEVHSEGWNKLLFESINFESYHDGPFSSYFCDLFINEPVLLHKFIFEELITNTYKFVYSLPLVRKFVYPMNTVGSQQCEENKYLLPWVKELYSRTKSQTKKLNSFEDC